MNVENEGNSEAYEETLKLLNTPFEIETEVATNQVSAFLSDFEEYQNKLLVRFVAIIFPLRTSAVGSEFAKGSEVTERYSAKSGSARSIARKFIARLVQDAHNLGMDLPQLEEVRWGDDWSRDRFDFLNLLTRASSSQTKERNFLQPRWLNLSRKARESPESFGRIVGFVLSDSQLFDLNSKGARHRQASEIDIFTEIANSIGSSGSPSFQAELSKEWIPDFVFEAAKKLRELAGE